MTPLEIRILEVATWILKVNPVFEHNYFRSEAIQPFHKRPSTQRAPISDLADFDLGAEKRRALLKEKHIPLVTLEEAATYGNLIYTLPEESVLDGGAEFYSQCLLDIWEVPAWDMWVTFGAHEFKEFEEYPNAVISWLPKTAANLFFSGLAVSILDNGGWVRLNSSSSFLAHLTIKPRHLEFIEIAEQDKAEIFSRLQLINGVGYDTQPTCKLQDSITDNYTNEPLIKRFFRKFQAWF